MTTLGSVRIRLFDVRGALVRTVADGSYPAGDGVAHWDGRNERGEPVASGIYFFRIETERGVATQRIAVLR